MPSASQRSSTGAISAAPMPLPWCVGVGAEHGQVPVRLLGVRLLDGAQRARAPGSTPGPVPASIGRADRGARRGSVVRPVAGRGPDGGARRGRRSCTRSPCLTVACALVREERPQSRGPLAASVPGYSQLITGSSSNARASASAQPRRRRRAVAAVRAPSATACTLTPSRLTVAVSTVARCLPIAELGARAKAASRVAGHRPRTEAKDAALQRGRRPARRAARRDPRRQRRRRGRRRGGRHGRHRRRPAAPHRPRRVEAMADGLRQVAALPDPVGEVIDGLDPAQRPAHRAGAGAARRGGDHLREPAQRHQRRLRPVPQVGQRRLPAGLVGRHPRRTSPSPPSCARASPRRACPRTPSCWSRTPATRRRSSSCSCATRSTASSRAAGRR